MNGFSLGKWVLGSALIVSAIGCGAIDPFASMVPPIAFDETSQGLVAALNEDHWTAQQDWTIWIAAAGGGPERIARWKHPAVRQVKEELQVNFRADQLSQPTDSGGIDSIPKYEWLSLVERDGLVGWNSLIFFARFHPQKAADHLPLLVELVAEPVTYTTAVTDSSGKTIDKSDRTSDNLRAAAAEACGFILQASESPSQEHVQLVLQLAERTDLPRDVQCDLFRALVGILPPREVPHLAEALLPQSSYNSENPPPSIEVRLAALDACLYYSLLNSRSPEKFQEDFPPNLFNLRNDPDSRLRIKIGQLAAVMKHPEAAGLLQDQLLDADTQVRLEALVGLGRLGTPAAREELLRQGESGEELIRVSATRGLAFFGVESIKSRLTDSSPHVRRELAAQLSKFQDQQSALLLKKLLVDSNLQVQMEVVRGLVNWPDQLAVPLLIYSLQESFTAARQASLTSLETRRGSPLIFPVHASREERLRESEKIARLWPASYSLELDELAARTVYEPEIEQARISELIRDLKTLSQLDPQDPRGIQLQRRLMNLKPSDVSWLERYLMEAPSSQRDWLLGDVLPKLDKAHAALSEMERPDVQVRRRGAEHLASEAIARPLNTVQLSRLEQILTREQDAQVWRFSMLAVEQDHSPQGVRIAQLAVRHAWPDIRILGCRKIARLEDSEQALWLVPLFGDENPQVRMAAVDAATKCRNPVVIEGFPGEGRPGVRSLMTADNLQLRVKACACLALFGDSGGSLELLRLARDSDWMVRYQAIESMGNSGQTRFVETLTQLGWTEKHPSVQKALLQALEQLVPPVQRPSELRPELTPEKQLEVWVNWWNRGHFPR